MESRTDQEQDKLINSKVSKQTLGIVASILVAGVGWALFAAASANGKAETAIQGVLEVKGDIKSINTSISNIEKNIDRLLKK